MKTDIGNHRQYEFSERQAWDFARSIGEQAKQKGRELVFTYCPYCHGGPNKEREKFAINLDTGLYKCMRASCDAHGNMITLARDFDFRLPGVEEAPKKIYRKFKTPEKPIEPKTAAVEYLEKRGISAAVVAKYEITTQNDADNILVFPFFDECGEMAFVKYRKTDFDRAKDKNKEWCERGGKPILFGMKQCKSNERLVITEGQIDSLSVAEAGIENAVSVPTGANGFTWVPNCWDFMAKYDEIVVFGDHEHGKITLLDEIAKRFGGKVKHVREEDYKDCKDANEILLKYGKEQIQKCIESAVFVPVDCVVDLSTVESINPHNVEKLKTGIVSLDRALSGGLPFGYYHVITGKRGDGKSTLASQICAEALNQGQTVFVYSGELPLWHFKAWIDYQIAGPQRIRDMLGDDGEPRWFISKHDREQIEAWYRGRLYMFDAEKQTDKQQDILKTTDEVIRRYGARVILLDNMMTAVDLDENARANKYDAQGEFAKKLSQIARKYNVLILLVAHKRKVSDSWIESDPNDDIGGSSYVTNLCGDIIGYSRPTKKQQKDKGIDEKNRVLTVTKNRLFGNVNYEGWEVQFNAKSKRIGNELDDLYRPFGWQGDDGFYPVPAEEEPRFE